MDELTFFQQVGGGLFMPKVFEASEAVAADVVRTGKKGKVTITLEIEPFKEGDVRVIVTETIKVAPPTEKSRGALFYAVDEGLHRDDPRQTVMSFREVDQATGEIREPSEKPAAVRGGESNG